MLLYGILQLLAGKKKSHVRDGYHFIDLFKAGRFSKHSSNSIFGSLDIKAMFPSIVMAEAIPLLDSRVINDPTLPDRTNIPPTELISLVKVCVADPSFECELGLFKQEDDTPMGGPLSCLMADIFMEDYGDKIDFHIEGTPLDLDWVRFRDDTFFELQHTIVQLFEFWEYLNSIYPAIQWDKPVLELNCVISFIDVIMKKFPDGSFTTSVYRKDTV